MNSRHLIIPVLLLACPLQVFAACQLEGKVSDHQNLPIANALIEVERAGEKLASVTTEVSGRYVVNFPKFPTPGIRAVTLRVAANGYTPDFRHLIRQGDCIADRASDVVLEPIAGAVAVPSSIGLTIFVAPFELYGNVSADQTGKFNRDLPKYLYHRISAYKSSLPLSTANFDITVDSIEEPLTVAAGEKILRLGIQLNALGVVAGDGEVSENPSELALNSVFRTIPAYGNTKIMHAPIADAVPLGNVSPSRVGRKMHDHWGKQAMLSYVLQQLVKQGNTLSVAQRNALSALLIEVRSTMKTDDHLRPVLEELLAVVAEPLP